MADNAYFSGNPVRLDISRSRMHANPRWTGHWNTGELVPIFATQVLPGSTYKMSVSSAIRMVTPVVPVMDDMDITIEAFYVPNRVLLSRQSFSPSVSDANHSWEAFIGAQDALLNMPTPGSVELPVCKVNTNYAYGGLFDCLGFPKPATGGSYYINCLKPLAYWSIFNDYWRDPNTVAPVTFSLSTPGDGHAHIFAYGSAASSLPTSGTLTLGDVGLAHVSRYHGYFGSALPWPQRNSVQMQFPFGTSADVKTSLTDGITGVHYPLLWKSTTGADETVAGMVGQTSGRQAILLKNATTSVDGNAVPLSTTPGNNLYPSNLYADLSQATAVTVNQFRLTVQTQRWYEQLARSGNKYPDLLSGMFDVSNAAIQTRPEYLGGFTAPIQLSQVAQTGSYSGSAGANANTGLGRVGAYSLSNPGGFLFTKSFTEHGILMVVATCRTKESFAQGLAREDSRLDRMDFYWPSFANIGEMPVLEKEIYCTGDSSNDDLVFGYQEAWAEERMIPDKVTGRFRPGQNMAHWTYVNNFSAAPTLAGYLDATGQQANVDRTLSVDHTTAGFQFFGQFEFDVTMVKPMPLYSIPGLVDHH